VKKHTCVIDLFNVVKASAVAQL